MLLRKISQMLGCLAVLMLASVSAWGQINNNTNGAFNTRAVGGVKISTDGVLGLPAVEDRRLLRDELLKLTHKAPAEMSAKAGLRMVSLRGLEAAIQTARDEKLGTLPDEVRFLAGLQRIQYVFVVPEQNDIVLAGPGEGWKVDENGNVVGITSGLPVIHLDDLAVALRTVQNARRGGILCSIDPTPEGLQAFEKVVRATKEMHSGVKDAFENAMGPQTIRVEGVPTTSHFARVLVASDYRMKRYAMEFDAPPVAGMPGFVSLIKSKRAALDSMIPRWWLACNYEPLAKSEDGLAWEVRGPGVKVMTENDALEGNAVKRTGKSNPIAKQWADNFTAKYAELSVKDPIFGELRNCMDMCVIAALIEREGWLNTFKLELPNLRSEQGGLELLSFNSPRVVPTRCSVTKVSNSYIILASGGVEINSWQVIGEQKTVAAVNDVRTQALTNANKKWWW